MDICGFLFGFKYNMFLLFNILFFILKDMYDLRIKEKNNINIILFCILISFVNSDF